MKSLWTVIKKELRRFFTDKRMLMALLLPGILIFIVYSVMGNVMKDVTTGKDHTFMIRVENQPSDPKYTFPALTGDRYVYLTETPSDYAEQIKEKKLDLYVFYEIDFEAKVAANDENDPAIVTFHYNAGNMNSLNVYSAYSEMLNAVLQPFVVTPVNHSETGDASMMMLTGLLPFLLITFLFSGAMAVAPESIAGEKERGTMASLLITPVKRSTIALGKVLALSIVAMASATSSFIGLILSLPKIIGGGASIDLSVYNFQTYVLLFLVLISTVLIFIMLISLISAYAKSLKEAGGLAAPLMILIMVAGVTTMFGSAVTNPFLYFIPVFNSVNLLMLLFSGKFLLVPFLITIFTNLAVTALGIYVLTLMFSSEKVMFRK